jgi:hypothetical protein
VTGAFRYDPATSGSSHPARSTFVRGPGLGGASHLTRMREVAVVGNLSPKKSEKSRVPAESEIATLITSRASNGPPLRTFVLLRIVAIPTRQAEGVR